LDLTLYSSVYFGLFGTLRDKLSPSLFRSESTFARLFDHLTILSFALLSSVVACYARTWTMARGRMMYRVEGRWSKFLYWVVTALPGATALYCYDCYERYYMRLASLPKS
jgi:hypothetical protein